MYNDLVLEFNITQKDHKETRDALIRTCHTFGQSVSRLPMLIALFTLFRCLHSIVYIPASSITTV